MEGSPKLHSSGPIPPNQEEPPSQPLLHSQESRRRTWPQNPGLITFAHAHLGPPSLERQRFTLSPHSREPSSTSAPGPLPGTVAPKGLRRPQAPCHCRGRWRSERPGMRAWPAPATPEAGTHLQVAPPPNVGRQWPEGPERHTAHAPRGRAGVTRQRYARRRLSPPEALAT